MVGAAAEAAVFKITQPKRDQRRLFKLQRISFFRRIIEGRQFLIHFDDFEGAFSQVVSFFRVERENLISG